MLLSNHIYDVSAILIIAQEIFDALKVIECKELIYNDWGFAEVDPIPRSILNFQGCCQ